MPASLQTPLIGLAIGLGLVAATFALERVSRKPRFVIALSLVAATMAVVGFVEIVGQTEDYRHVWLGMNLSGRFAVAAGLVDIAIYMVGAVGLWLLKRWARTGAMIYLLYLLVSFVIWGVRGGSGEGVVVIMAWQMTTTTPSWLGRCSYCRSSRSR